MSVADVGRRGRVLLVRFARDVGREGRVVAADIDPHMIGQLQLERVLRQAWNVSPKLVDDEVGLAPESVDLALIVDAYQFRDCRLRRNRAYLRELARSLRPGGRVIIADGFMHPRVGLPRNDAPENCSNVPPTQLSALALPYLSTRKVLPVPRQGYRSSITRSRAT